MILSFSGKITANGSGLCEVAENRSRKFRFRRHVAKANFYLLTYEKKPIKLAFADYEAQNFQLSLNPPFCKTLVGGSFFYFSVVFAPFWSVILKSLFSNQRAYIFPLSEFALCSKSIVITF